MVRAPMMLTWLFKPIISYFRCLSKIRLNLLFYALLNYIHYISGAMFQLVRNSRYWLSYFYIPIAHPLGRSVIIFNRPKSTSTNFPMVIIGGCIANFVLVTYVDLTKMMTLLSSKPDRFQQLQLLSSKWKQIL